MSLTTDLTRLGYPDVPSPHAPDLAQKDPRGLVRADIEHLKKVFRPKAYTPTDSKEVIMYTEGQQSVIAYIEERMIAKR